jgi:signal transduction histidine kinase/ActR/RegA family two-component response regulator
MSAPAASLDFARALLTCSAPEEILRHACREAIRLTQARLCLASHATPGQPWERRANVVVPGGVEVPPRVSSALFALHRRLASTGGATTVERSDETAAIFEAIGALAPGALGAALHVVPIVHRTGRLAGELVIAGIGADPAGRAALTEVARLAAAAMEGAQRLAFARRDQQRLQLLAEASEEALWDWDVQTSEFWWGGGVQKLLGRDPTDVLHTLEWKFARIHPDDVDRVRASFRRALDSPTESSWRDEYRCRRGTDGSIDVEDRAYFMRSSSGRAHRVLGAMRDVSRLRRLLEREREARAEAETASRAKDEFLAMLGHELRNPLSPIFTALALMRMRGDREIERERSVIERQARHMARLVDDLLDVSRIAAGKVELQRIRVEMLDVIHRAAEMVRPLLEERQQELQLRVPEGGLPIEGDTARLAQVFSNLLTNAAKYSRPGGIISVAAVRQGEQVEVTVADEGIGIEPEMIDRIFDMFVQERQALDRSRGGLGLGLAIARSVVVLHGGSIAARSAGRERGSQFTVTLPLATSGRASASPGGAVRPGATGTALGGLRILVVDDNEDSAALLAEYLRELGGDAVIALDGPEAIDAFGRRPPDVVLLDIGLPVIDGYEVARRLRLLPGGDRVRLIAVTGYGQQGDRRRALASGFDDHLVKPVGLERLARAILAAEALGQRELA